MKNIAKYESQLKAREQELQVRLNKIEGDLDAPMSPDSEERATEREDDEVLEHLGQAGRHELKAIEAALQRIVVGTYGTCVRCGADISEERLNLVPHAALCMECMRPS